MALPAVADSEHLNKFKLDYKQSKFSLNSYQGYIFANGITNLPNWIPNQNILWKQ